MAALEVFSAVFTALSVDFTVPFAPAFTVCFPAERADCLMVRSVRSADLMVWFRLLRMLVRVASVFAALPAVQPPLAAFCLARPYAAPPHSGEPVLHFVDALFIAVLPVRLLAFFNGFFVWPETSCQT